LHDRHRFAGRILQFVQLGLLRIGGVKRLFDFLNWQVGKALFWLLAGFGCLRGFARLGIGGGVLWAELVEAFLLLVAELSARC
jgi:hypothetical protein